jgi:hypothetical protein
MNTLKARLVGDAPLLMHSCALVDKFHPISREMAKLTGKRKKTDDDTLEIKRVEWFAGLYLSPEGEVSIPADNIIAMMIEASKKAKLGKQAKAAIFETQPYYKLIYDGPKKPDELYADGRFCDYRSAGIMGKKIMRSRPIFRAWELDISIQYDETIIDPSSMAQALRIAGEQIGIGDWRPRFGRFHVKK